MAFSKRNDTILKKKTKQYFNDTEQKGTLFLFLLVENGTNKDAQ